MLCYQDSTFCTGGKPLCAKFSTCPKALTDEHKAKAKERRLPINIYVSANSMPCYTDTIELPPMRRVKARKRKRNKTDQRRTFKVASIPEALWRRLFEARPAMGNHTIADKLGCSNTIVGVVRKRLGYKPHVQQGASRPPMYTHEDVEKIARIRRPDEPLRAAARRAGYSSSAANHICHKFRLYFDAVR